MKDVLYSIEIFKIEATCKFSHPADTLALAAKGGCTLSEEGVAGDAVAPVVALYIYGCIYEGEHLREPLTREVRIRV